MINQYGADSVRWFILSDSPPDKDIQWSATGVEAANKFLQKIWNLNYLVFNRDVKSSNKEKENKLLSEINNFVFKIDESISSFKFNVSISYFYQVYKILKECIESEISNKVLKENITKIMTLMMPFTPHLSHECLELMKSSDYNKWPEIDKKDILREIKLAVQINGKTRDIISIDKDLNEEEVNVFIIKHSKAKKYVDSKKIIKTIFVKNKIINYIVNSK